MKKYILSTILLVFSICSFSQKIWTGDIDTVGQSGYYNIQLDQRLIGDANSNFSDLRILSTASGDTTEVPYFARPVTPIREISNFESYKLYKNELKDSFNVVIVDNANKDDIDRFYLVISNADVQIEMSIRGSNDLKQWYVVKQRTAISNHRDKQQVDAMLLADFPRGNYKYYELTIENNQKSPLQIKRVGKLSSSSIYGQTEVVSVGKHLQKEDDKGQTIITFPSLQNTYLVSRMEFILKTATLYLRDAKMIDTLHYDRFSFELSSKKDNIYLLNDFALQGSTSIQIDNKSNPALTIDSIQFSALKRYVCAYLERGQKYTLELNNQKYKAPSYDIKHFQNDIAVDLPMVLTNNLSSEDYPKPEVKVREQMFIEKPVVLWSIIIGLGIFLTFICIRMVNKMNKSKDQEL